MQLIVIDSFNKIVFSKEIQNETVRDIKYQISLYLKIKTSKFMLLHENIPLKNKQQISLLSYQSSILLSIKNKKSFFTRMIKIIEKLIHISSISNIMKIITLLALFLTDNKILASLIFVIYILISISSKIRYRIDTSLGSNLKIIGKVFLCFVSSMFMIYSEENFI